MTPVLHLDAEFFKRTEALSQAQIDWLVVRHGVPIAALMHDGDGGGQILGAARVERCGRRFEFRDDGPGAYLVLARDVDGEPIDLVAWEPRHNWFASWLGAVPLIGMHELLAPRIGEPLATHLELLPWLQSGRQGVVVLDRKHAWRALQGVTLSAASIEIGIALRRILSAPEPKIVVPAATLERAAA